MARRAVELSAALEAVDVPKVLTGKVEPALVDRANSLAEPQLENAKAKTRAAQAALDVLTTSEVPRSEDG